VTITTELFATVAEPLAGLGFKKRTGGIFTKPVDDEFLGWLGLNTATEHFAGTAVRVLPVLGVRHHPTERLIAELSDRQFHAYLPPTISAPLGELRSPRRFETFVVERANPSESVDGMVAAIAEVGPAFIERNASLPALRARLDDGLTVDEVPYRRAVTALLDGHIDEALDLVDSTIAELGERDDLAAAAFRRFAANLHRYAEEPGVAHR
jgi:hypothetical protein